MKEKLQAIIDELNAREMRAIARGDKKRELGNPIEASKQDGKFIAYRYARELVEELLADLELEEDPDAFDQCNYDDYDEVGYNPYTGGFDPDL